MAKTGSLARAALNAQVRIAICDASKSFSMLQRPQPTWPLSLKILNAETAEKLREYLSKCRPARSYRSPASGHLRLGKACRNAARCSYAVDGSISRRTYRTRGADIRQNGATSMIYGLRRGNVAGDDIGKRRF